MKKRDLSAEAEEMQKKAKKLEIEKGDVIFADDATIIGKDIPEYIDKMKALIYTKGPNKNLSLPQISRRDIRLLVSDNYAIVKKDELEKAISAGKSRSPEYIKKIFDEYKKKRSDNI